MVKSFFADARLLCSARAVQFIRMDEIANGDDWIFQSIVKIVEQIIDQANRL